MNEITLLIADDHPLFRQGVVDTLSLEKDFQIIAQAADGDEAIELIRSLKPRVAVLDVNMPGLNGQQVTHQVTSEHLPTRVVLLTGYDDIEQAIHAVLAGAVGYCAKDIEPEVLARTVRAVADGKTAAGALRHQSPHVEGHEEEGPHPRRHGNESEEQDLVRGMEDGEGGEGGAHGPRRAERRHVAADEPSHGHVAE